MVSVPAVALTDDLALPRVGLGVYKVPAGQAGTVVREALRVGYRAVDTATLYGNEAEVGAAVRGSGLARDEVVVTTKLWNDDHGRERTLRAFDASSERLGLDVLDLYLVHWPVPSRDLYVETWRTLLELRDAGRVRAVGVSNFHAHHLQRLHDETGEWPVLNQVELHPRLPQRALRAFHAERGIVTQAWSPLARGGLLDHPVLGEIGRRLGRSPAQVVLRWHLQHDVAVIPKSVTPARLVENLDVLGFTLDGDDLARIDALEDGHRTGRDPDTD
ncbi:aldo/keto reductase [Cellulomonas endophytica]|uniref:aldo/keto reductase n=1 Tax=Cellulomonas endophytica TaxID=2494735 RepID=UPI00196A9B3E|nr:aldo/keto reductase [Cellulomonas endophytica]